MTSDRQCDVMGTRRLNLNTAVLNLNMTFRRPTSGGGGPPHQDPAAPTKHRVWRERPMDEVITICTSQNCTLPRLRAMQAIDVVGASAYDHSCRPFALNQCANPERHRVGVSAYASSTSGVFRAIAVPLEGLSPTEA